MPRAIHVIAALPSPTLMSMSLHWKRPQQSAYVGTKTPLVRSSYAPYYGAKRRALENYGMRRLVSQFNPLFLPAAKRWVWTLHRLRNVGPKLAGNDARLCFITVNG